MPEAIAEPSVVTESLGHSGRFQSDLSETAGPQTAPSWAAKVLPEKTVWTPVLQAESAGTHCREKSGAGAGTYIRNKATGDHLVTEGAQGQPREV